MSDTNQKRVEDGLRRRRFHVEFEYFQPLMMYQIRIRRPILPCYAMTFPVAEEVLSTMAPDGLVDYLEQGYNARVECGEGERR